MLFSSLTFLFYFLPLTIICYFILPFRIWRNLILLAASLLFYSWGEPRMVILMVVEVLLTYGLTLFMDKSQKGKKLLLILTVELDLLILICYKYTNFFVVLINDIFHTSIETLEISLPVGISFYTFQMISYVVDVYRNKAKVQKNPLNLLLYVSMFPQLIAGPIVRYESIEKEIEERKETFEGFANGLRRFITGLGKKIIFANSFAVVSDYVFKELPVNEYTSTLCWLGAIAYTLQIYFDFSGYSDMAIGLGKMFGFTYPENFNYPYIASSITDFWRRWHMSLSSWFRDYVYIPLGGNRVPKWRWFLNIFIVWLLTGFWHGASYNFILWGLYFGVILVIEKLFLLKVLKYAYVIRNIYSLLLIIIGWVIFNCSGVEQIRLFLSAMFSSLPHFSIEFMNELNYAYLIIYFILGILFCTPLMKYVTEWMNKIAITGVIYDAALVLILAVCVMFLINNSYNPFLYFRF